VGLSCRIPPWKRLGAYAGVCALAYAFGSPAQALPDQPPWDFSGGTNFADCTGCHFSSEAISASPQLRLEGLPDQIVAGEVYEFLLSLRDEDAANAGFVLRAESPDPGGPTVGEFKAVDGRVEPNGGAVRSTMKGSVLQSPGLAQWRFIWSAPANLARGVLFRIAAIAGNDDKSPFGDDVHLQEYAVDAGG